MTPQLGDTTISATALDSTISLTSAQRFAGAIDSLTFRGKEYVNAADHGRELQSASSFDGLGECFNPTEAGDSTDQATSSSDLLQIDHGPTWLTTQTQMAFWLLPGEDYESLTDTFCGNRPDVTHAVNTTVLSQHVLNTRVDIGYGLLPNVINYQVDFLVPEIHTTGTFEAATIYTPPEFNQRWELDLGTGTLLAATALGQQALPVILSTSDNQYAVGIYSPGLPQNDVTYGSIVYSNNTSKLNCVYQETAVVPQDYHYQCFFAIGTLLEVVSALRTLHASLQPAV